jgi:hypothetical protein
MNPESENARKKGTTNLTVPPFDLIPESTVPPFDLMVLHRTRCPSRPRLSAGQAVVCWMLCPSPLIPYQRLSRNEKRGGALRDHLHHPTILPSQIRGC